MKERIKRIRKELNMTRPAFAEKLSATGNYIYMIESGRSVPSDKFINSLCKEFKVNKEWLLTGNGDMRAVCSKAEEIGAIVAALYEAEADSLKYRFLKLIADASEDELKVILKFAQELTNEN